MARWPHGCSSARKREHARGCVSRDKDALQKNAYTKYLISHILHTSFCDWMRVPLPCAAACSRNKREPDDGRVQSKHHIRAVSCGSDDSSAIPCKSDTGCTKARPRVAHTGPAECRELLMDGENRRRHLLLERRAVAIPSWRAAPSIPSWRTAPLPSPHREPRCRRPFAEGRAALSPLSCRAARLRRPWLSAVASAALMPPMLLPRGMPSAVFAVCCRLALDDSVIAVYACKIAEHVL
jgi:hypothetical protein